MPLFSGLCLTHQSFCSAGDPSINTPAAPALHHPPPALPPAHAIRPAPQVPAAGEHLPMGRHAPAEAHVQTGALRGAPGLRQLPEQEDAVPLRRIAGVSGLPRDAGAVPCGPSSRWAGPPGGGGRIQAGYTMFTRMFLGEIMQMFVGGEGGKLCLPPSRYGIQMREHDRRCSAQSRGAPPLPPQTLCANCELWPQTTRRPKFHPPTDQQDIDMSQIEDREVPTSDGLKGWKKILPWQTGTQKSLESLEGGGGGGAHGTSPRIRFPFGNPPPQRLGPGDRGSGRGVQWQGGGGAVGLSTGEGGGRAIEPPPKLEGGGPAKGLK